MKVSFYAAAIIGLLSFNQVQAVSLESQNWLFSQTDIDTDSNTFGESNSLTAADCEETVNGVTLKLQTPECEKTKEEPKVDFEKQMLGALQDLSSKSIDLYDALKLQFAKNAKLAQGTPMAISGQVVVKPKIDSDPTEGA